MAEYLVFRLYGPMASWGEIAVGESRHSASQPSRSALLGLLGAALGVRREDDDAQARLNAGYRFGIKLHATGHPLRDYHTVQAGPQLKKLTYRTRRQELALPTREQLGTLLSAREYRCDAFATVAVGTTPEAPWSLGRLTEALRYPAFPLYLGRKSCPLSAPLAPRVAEFDSLKSALDAFDASPFPELDKDATRASNIAQRWLKLGSGQARYYWDEAWGVEALAPDSPATMSLTRHDTPTSRRRWQFSPRQEFMRLEDAS
ncbi:type I-E CRISPR-associated protein Cas5/CasD [Aromatoleum toluvorans]|uniref:Type I-E CRISPR-associated protein Cas5/CasD n=1 Tax=Aromatoleum toluvorans TaxID=92002 RepID=A0ABX1PZ88_9RHOO|nr:type I-E CRISPR-associated protein Cas5/CasD [Aromatoleum toluvorans]NMG44762.1 type I-E CRISPR-associated protein Cas5/CasD [Aromatoleum toluvorans]